MSPQALHGTYRPHKSHENSKANFVPAQVQGDILDKEERERERDVVPNRWEATMEFIRCGIKTREIFI